jgi:hypothetical protein
LEESIFFEGGHKMAKKNREEGTAEEFDENGDVELTEEELEDTGAEASVPKKKREPSRKTILLKQVSVFLTEHTDELPEELATMIRELKTLPGRAGRAEGKASIAAQLREMILSEKEIHEDVFYAKFKLGRLEMKRRFYNMRKKISDPKDAVYVSFDPETGIYRYEGEGETPPANWIEK